MAMNISYRSSDIESATAEAGKIFQRTGNPTVVTGAGTFIPLETIYRLAGDPEAVAKFLEEVIEGEHLYAMAILGPKVTGIDHVLWYVPVPGGPHGPRIKVAIDPPRTKRRGGVEATVPFDENKAAIGPIPAQLERQVREFIDLNRDVLLEYWALSDDVPDTHEFTSRLKPIR
jgi:hypothetical protein